MIDQLIKKIAKSQDTTAILCKVSEVDENTLVCVCSPVNGDADILEVRLTAQDNGIVVIPEIDSIVVVDMLSNNHGYISLYSAIKSVQFNVASNSFTIDKDGLKLSGSTADFKTELLNLYSIVNKILTELLVFKVNTAVGPSVSVFPDNIVNINRYKLELTQSETKIKTILN